MLNKTKLSKRKKFNNFKLKRDSTHPLNSTQRQEQEQL